MGKQRDSEMRIVTGLLAAVLLVSYLSVDGVLEHEDSIELGDGAPTPVLAAHNERLKQGIAQLQNGKTLSPAKPARHDSALELREEDAAAGEKATPATEKAHKATRKAKKSAKKAAKAASKAGKAGKDKAKKAATTRRRRYTGVARRRRRRSGGICTKWPDMAICKEKKKAATKEKEKKKGSQMASSATKDTSLGESVQVRQKARFFRRRRKFFKFKTVKAVTGFKAVSKSVKHMAKNFSKGIKKVNSMAQEAAQKRNAAVANEAAQKRNAAVAKEAAQKAAAKVKAAAEKAVKAVKKNASRVIKKAVKKEVKKDVKKYVAIIRRRRRVYSSRRRSWRRRRRL